MLGKEARSGAEAVYRVDAPRSVRARGRGEILLAGYIACRVCEADASSVEEHLRTGGCAGGLAGYGVLHATGHSPRGDCSRQWAFPVPWAFFFSLFFFIYSISIFILECKFLTGPLLLRSSGWSRSRSSGFLAEDVATTSPTYPFGLGHVDCGACCVRAHLELSRAGPRRPRLLAG